MISHFCQFPLNPHLSHPKTFSSTPRCLIAKSIFVSHEYLKEKNKKVGHASAHEEKQRRVFLSEQESVGSDRAGTSS